MPLKLQLLVALAACGPLRNPFDGLPAGACAQDVDCVVASCANACNQGQPWCRYPRVAARVDAVKACPCLDTPMAPSCAAPSKEACGPQPGCAVMADVQDVRARCVTGTCAARFVDGGVVP